MQSYSLEYRPNLAAKINFYQSQVIVSQAGINLSFPVEQNSRQKLEKLLFMMDGTNSVEQLQQKIYPHQPEEVNSILQSLDKQGFLDTTTKVHLNSGIDTMLELQELSEDLLNDKYNSDRLWQSLTSESSEISSKVIYGFAIEHYYLFSSQYLNRTSLPGLQHSAIIKQLIERIYFQEYSCQEYLSQALNAIALDREKLANTIPLAETMALSNALAYWANVDPIFYLVAVGLLSNRIEYNFELYLQACEQTKLDKGFIIPIKELVNNRLQRQSEDVAVQIFKEIPYIDRETKQRLRETTYLLIETYSNFYLGIWDCYSSSKNLPREIAAI